MTVRKKINSSIRPSECFRCDGSGTVCNICGESPRACGCDEAEVEEYVEQYGGQLGQCEDCKGTGK